MKIDNNNNATTNSNMLQELLELYCVDAEGLTTAHAVENVEDAKKILAYMPC